MAKFLLAAVLCLVLGSGVARAQTSSPCDDLDWGNLSFDGQSFDGQYDGCGDIMIDNGGV